MQPSHPISTVFIGGKLVSRERSFSSNISPNAYHHPWHIIYEQPDKALKGTPSTCRLWHAPTDRGWRLPREMQKKRKEKVLVTEWQWRVVRSSGLFHNWQSIRNTATPKGFLPPAAPMTTTSKEGPATVTVTAVTPPVWVSPRATPVWVTPPTTPWAAPLESSDR